MLQRNCASGLDALMHAAHAITAGEGDVFLVGGVESMSRAPLVIEPLRARLSARDQKLFDSTIGPRFSNPKLIKQFGDDQMPQTADNLAREYGIKREEADTFALRSQQRYADRQGRGLLLGRDLAGRNAGVAQGPGAAGRGRRASPSRYRHRSAGEDEGRSTRAVSRRRATPRA